MDDRQLLEDAARAAGNNCAPIMFNADKGVSWGSGWWSPLTNDGDALRLAVRLGIAIDTAAMRVWAFRSWGTPTVMAQEEFFGSDPHNGSKDSATRRAITRAAAAIGQKMREAGNG